MKHYLFRGMIYVAILFPCLISCSRINPPSNFLNTFSPGETIKRMNQQGITPSSSSMSSTASAGEPSPHRHDFHLKMIIKESMAGSFDERDFLAKLNEKITQEVVDSGAKVLGGGNGNDCFHIDYGQGKQNGGIEVIGVRTEKNKYEVWCIIRELAVNDGGKS